MVLWPAQICCQESGFVFRGVHCGSSVQCINISITTETPWVSCNNHTFSTTLLLKPKPLQGTKHKSPGPAVHFAVLCEDPALIPSKAFVKTAVAGWHRSGWQGLSWSARVAGMSHVQTFPDRRTTATNKKHFCCLSKHGHLQHQAIPELCSLLGTLSRGSHWVYCTSCDLTSWVGSLLRIFPFCTFSVYLANLRDSPVN